MQHGLMQKSLFFLNDQLRLQALELRPLSLIAACSRLLDATDIPFLLACPPLFVRRRLLLLLERLAPALDPIKINLAAQ